MKMSNYLRICIPFYSDFKEAKKFLELVGYEQVPRQGTCIWEIRNDLITDRSINGSKEPLSRDYFLIMDSDVSSEDPEIIERLIAHDKYIIGGAYKKHRTNKAYAWKNDKLLNVTETGLQEVDAVGTGFVLVKREVFLTIPYPWFYCPAIDGEVLSMDRNFCLNASDAGFEVWCDFDIKLNHKERTARDFDW